MNKNDLSLESKIQALEELLMVSETSFLEESQKLEEVNKQLAQEMVERKESEERFKSIANTAQDAIIMIDNSGLITFWNSSAENIFGYPAEEAIGKNLHALLAPARFHGAHKKAFPEFQTTGKGAAVGKNIELAALRKNGNEFPIELSLSSVFLKNSWNAVGIIRDISEKKLAQKTAEENALQQGRIEMSNNMMHDIGNALTGISACTTKPQTEKNWPEIDSLKKLGSLFASKEKELVEIFGEEKEKSLISFIEALSESFQSRNARYIEFCEKISHAIGHISSILELQKYYLKEKTTSFPTVLVVRKLIEDALIILSSSLEKRKIAVKITTDGSNPSISGDQTRLMRMLLNIIKNIYEAFDGVDSKSGRKLEINLTSDMKSKEVKIVFSDNGGGFSMENGNKLFERGFSTKPTGSGIGLHECRAIVDSHGGTITISSKGENAGSQTVINIPLLNNNKA